MATKTKHPKNPIAELEEVRTEKERYRLYELRERSGSCPCDGKDEACKRCEGSGTENWVKLYCFATAPTLAGVGQTMDTIAREEYAGRGEKGSKYGVPPLGVLDGIERRWIQLPPEWIPLLNHPASIAHRKDP